MMRASRPITARTACLLLLLSTLNSAESLSNDNTLHTENTDNSNNEAQRELQRDDETFWSRFVEEVVSSSFTEPPTPPPPTKPPAPGPTDLPTKIPSEAPTELEVACQIDVEIECMAEDGTECTDLQPPQGSCTLTDLPITELKFKLVDCRCGDSLNSQEGSTCTDFSAFPTDGAVSVSCVEDSSVGRELTVSPSNLASGETLVITSPDGSALPPIKCIISDDDGNNPIQEFTFATGGGSSLSLKDKFGSFELLSCVDQAGASRDCEVLLCYTYDFKNVGTNDMDITLIEITRNDVTESLLSLLDVTSLKPGEETNLIEKDIIDICVDETYTTSVSVEADPPNGITCFAEEKYTFGIEVACKVDVEIICESETGVECSELTSPSGSCNLMGGGGALLTELNFRYTECTCKESAGSNTQPNAPCADFAALPTGMVDLECSSVLDGTDLTVSPNTMSPGDTILVTTSDGAPLPSQIRCLISEASTGTGTIFQQFSFFTQDGFELSLEDKFGSLELVSCSNEAGQQLGCEMLLCYEYDLRNVGTNDMDITLFERTRNNGTAESLLDLINVTTLEPGDSVEVVEKELVNLCVEGGYSTSVSVEADPPNGITCFDEDMFVFTIDPPCQIFVQLECSTFSGVPCTDLEGEQFVECDCADACARELIYRYTGSTCDGLAGCSDSGANATDSVTIVVQGGGSTLFDDTVLLDENLVLQNSGECLPDVLEVTVTAPGADTPSQSLAVDSSCAGSVTLLDSFGSLEFAGYTCANETAHNCYTAAEYSITTSNVGTVAQTVNSWEFDLNGDIRLPGMPLPTLEPKEDFSLFEATEIELCADTQYTASVNVTAIGAVDGKVCEDVETLNFDISTGTPFPSPSEPPTGLPSQSSTPAPSPEPTPDSASEPTLGPTPEGTPGPTPESTPGQTPGPTTPPQPETTPEPTPFPTTPPQPGPTPPPTPEPSFLATTPPDPTPPPTPESSPLPTTPPVPDPTPTPEPTPIPTTQPQPDPTPPPTPEPSSGATPEPTPGPTPELTPAPTPGSTLPPTLSPTATGPASTGTPSAQPSEVCMFEMDATCIPPDGTTSCNATPPPVEQCEGRPFEMVFLFNGGDCDQSYNVQEADGKFFCTDSGEGVPTERGEKSYIVVTDLDGETIFHDDWVVVGELFTLIDGGNNFPANQLITIFNSDDTANAANVLQSVQYHSSCSQNLFLKDRFGAVQLVIWVNEDQGTVSCFANQTFELDITVPIDIEGGPAVFTGLTVASNVDPFFFNLTDKVAGTVADAGETFQVEISIPIDLTQKRTYNLLITLTAVTQTQLCTATELTSFSAGYPLPPIFPTFSPTQSPTGTDSPTPDPESTACELGAEIQCQTSSGRSCRSLRAPASLVCSAEDGDVSSIEFLVTGKPCGATEDCEDFNDITTDEVFIFAEGDNIVAFQGAVRVGEFFTLSNGLEDGSISVTISSVTDAVPSSGLPLQIISNIDLGCEGQAGEDLTLLEDFGALQLTSFTNDDQGVVSILEDVTMTYVVRNDGVLSATATSAVRTSAFEGMPVVFLDGGDPLLLAPAEESSFDEATTPINLQDQAGREYRFDMSVSGEGTESGLACEDATTFVFRVDAA